MIDWQQVRQLQEDVGAEEMSEVVELFICEVDEAIETLQNEYATLAANDRSAAFHFLKGCASNLGFKDFCDQCSIGEEITRKGADPDFEMSDLVSLYVISKEQFLQNYETELGKFDKNPVTACKKGRGASA